VRLVNPHFRFEEEINFAFLLLDSPQIYFNQFLEIKVHRNEISNTTKP